MSTSTRKIDSNPTRVKGRYYLSDDEDDLSHVSDFSDSDDEVSPAPRKRKVDRVDQPSIVDVDVVAPLRQLSKVAEAIQRRVNCFKSAPPMGAATDVEPRLCKWILAEVRKLRKSSAMRQVYAPPRSLYEFCEYRLTIAGDYLELNMVIPGCTVSCMYTKLVDPLEDCVCRFVSRAVREYGVCSVRA